MTKIYVYGAEATYGGRSEFDWAAPSVGATHRLMLFLAQEEDVSKTDVAKAELVRFGFQDISIGAGSPVDVEALNTPHMNAFRRHYEGAFEEGSSLVWYA